MGFYVIFYKKNRELSEQLKITYVDGLWIALHMFKVGMQPWKYPQDHRLNRRMNEYASNSIECSIHCTNLSFLSFACLVYRCFKNVFLDIYVSSLVLTSIQTH